MTRLVVFMRILHKSDLNEYSFISSDAPECVDYVSREVLFGELSEVKSKERAFNNLDRNWRMILEVLNYDTAGKKILDLGCGCFEGNVESGRYDGMYGSWMGKFMSLTKEKTGLEYIGVDCGDNSSESFDSRKIDLLEEGALVREFSEGYFDLATGFMLFNSPELEKRVSGMDVRDAHGSSGKKLADVIFPQLEKIVKKNGSFLWSGGEAMWNF